MIPFESAVYKDRRAQLMKTVGSGWILLPGHTLTPRNYTDNTYPFRQDSTFLYYAGLDLPGLCLLMNCDEGKTILCGKEHTVDDVIWMGPQPSLSELSALIGTDEVWSIDQLSAKLNGKSAGLHYLPLYQGHSILKVAQWLGVSAADITGGASEVLVDAVINQRAIKEARELEQIETALEITRDMHMEVIYQTGPGKKEADLVAALMHIAHQRGVDMAYPVILTVHGETLHMHHHSNQLQAGQLLLGDFGAESPAHYASDITRTIPVSRSFSNQQKEIYQVVLDALEHSATLLAPAVPYQEVHLAAARLMTKGLKEIGLMKGDPEEAVAAGAHALFFPHGLGHMMGLDVHDMEDLGENRVGYQPPVSRSTQFGLSALRLGRALQPGYVLTVEPGIYFIPALIDLWKSEGKFKDFINYGAIEQYRDFGGIRIEDNYLITSDQTRLLGPPIPKTIDEIEFLRGLDKYIA